MARTKSELLKDAQQAGLVSEDANPDDYSADDLNRVLNPEAAPVWQGSLSSSKPIIAPDGHVVLSQEDIDRAKA